MESSRRDLLNDMAEHRHTLKKHIVPRFGFTPKTGTAFNKTGFCFYCERGDEGRERGGSRHITENMNCRRCSTLRLRRELILATQET